MTLALAWRDVPPPLNLRWRLIDDADETAFARGTLPNVPTIIGPPGTPANANTILVAGEAIGGHRAIYVGTDGLAWLASSATAVAFPPIGISVAAGAQGDSFAARSAGLITEGSWNWSTGPIYLGAAGMLTQAVPTTGAIVKMGVAAGPTRMRLEPQFIAAL